MATRIVRGNITIDLSAVLYQDILLDVDTPDNKRLVLDMQRSRTYMSDIEWGEGAEDLYFSMTNKPVGGSIDKSSVTNVYLNEAGSERINSVEYHKREGAFNTDYDLGALVVDPVLHVDWGATSAGGSFDLDYVLFFDEISAGNLALSEINESLG
jgi:hypothetical protein